MSRCYGTFPALVEFDSEGEAWRAEVVVQYTVTGRHWPGTHEEPPEAPELEVTAVELRHDLPTLGLGAGDDVDGLLDRERSDALHQAAWDHHTAQGDAYP